MGKAAALASEAALTCVRLESSSSSLLLPQKPGSPRGFKHEEEKAELLCGLMVPR